MSAPAPVVLPPLTGALDRLWDLVLDLADRLDPAGWVLVGGQMVMLHGLAAGRSPPRASQDVDVLADLLTDPTGLSRCVQAVRQLDLAPEPDSAGKVYRFRRTTDGAVVDVLAPDHSTSPPRGIRPSRRRRPPGTSAPTRRTGSSLASRPRSHRARHRRGRVGGREPAYGGSHPGRQVKGAPADPTSPRSGCPGRMPSRSAG